MLVGAGEDLLQMEPSSGQHPLGVQMKSGPQTPRRAVVVSFQSTPSLLSENLRERQCQLTAARSTGGSTAEGLAVEPPVLADVGRAVVGSVDGVEEGVGLGGDVGELAADNAGSRDVGGDESREDEEGKSGVHCCK